MAQGIKLLVTGDYAFFTRPEMKAERVSYDVISPSAARGILECIHWKPAIVWVVDKIHVLNPIRFDSVRRNEVSGKIGINTITSAMNNATPLQLLVEDSRQQRASLLLRDVAYVMGSLNFLSGGWSTKIVALFMKNVAVVSVSMGRMRRYFSRMFIIMCR